jgi:hypothetical protein
MRLKNLFFHAVNLTILRQNDYPPRLLAEKSTCDVMDYGQHSIIGGILFENYLCCLKLYNVLQNDCACDVALKMASVTSQMKIPTI